MSKLDDMNKTINENLCGIPLPRNQIVPGAFCLAPFYSGDSVTYYRARIRAVSPVGEVLVSKLLI